MASPAALGNPIVQDFDRALADLPTPDKTRINFLTQLAEECVAASPESAPGIVEALNHRIMVRWRPVFSPWVDM